jgi:hypothetical protein
MLRRIQNSTFELAKESLDFFLHVFTLVSTENASDFSVVIPGR